LAKFDALIARGVQPIFCAPHRRPLSRPSRKFLISDLSASLYGIFSPFEVLQYDSGFTAMSSGVRVPSEFAVHTALEIILDNYLNNTTPPTYINKKS
jgi:hypothetical protein